MPTSYTVFDTDMQIHRLCKEPGVGDAAEAWRVQHRPVRVGAFSKVEFKAAYIQRLALLRNKVRRSENLKEVFARVKNAGQRPSQMMLAQLVGYLEVSLSVRDWAATQGILLTHLDAQIGASWAWFVSSVDGVADPAKCSRAREAPSSTGSSWDLTIPRCEKRNTHCSISQHFSEHRDLLAAVVQAIDATPSEQVSAELSRIRKHLSSFLQTGSFAWEGTTCRSIGDLLVCLHALDAQMLVTSNHKEHQCLGTGMPYRLKVFPVAELRLK